MAESPQQPPFHAPSQLLAVADKELAEGNIAIAFELYARAGRSPSTDQLMRAADLLLDRGKIPYALRLYRRAKVIPDRQKLMAAAVRGQNEGMIYPDIYDFLMAAL